MLVPPDNFGLVEPGLYRCSKLDPDNFPFLETLSLKSILLLDAENPPRHLKSFISDNSIDLINLGGLKISNHNHTGANNNNANNREDEDKHSITERPIRPEESEPGSTISDTISTTTRSSRPNSTTGSPVINTQAPREINFQLINLNNTTKKNDQWMLIEKNLIKRAFEILFNKTKYNILVVDSSSTLVSILRKIQKWNFNSIVNEFRIYNGNSAKSNYFAENFLELVDVELIAYEVDQVIQFQKLQNQDKPQTLSKSPEIYKTTSWNQNSQPMSHKNSIDDENLWEGYSKEMIDDDEIDDELLSASPQIPANLLKMVEKKRQNSIDMSDDDKATTPGTSPRLTNNSDSPVNTDPMTISARHYLEKRRPSMDANKIMRPSYNTVFRNSFGYQSPSGRSSFDNVNYTPGSRRSSRMERKSSLKFEDLKDFDEKKIREVYDFKYYNNLNKNHISFDNVGYIRLKLPPTGKLPDWFIRGRDFWESSPNRFNEYE